MATTDTVPPTDLPDIATGEPYLLYVGDLRVEKGIDVLLDAYGRLARRRRSSSSAPRRPTARRSTSRAWSRWAGCRTRW